MVTTCRNTARFLFQVWKPAGLVWPIPLCNAILAWAKLSHRPLLSFILRSLSLFTTMYSVSPTPPPLPFGMSRPASDFLNTKDDPPFLSAPAPQRLNLLRKLSWQESSPRSTPSPFSLAPSSVPPFCSPMPMPLPTSTMLSETTLQLAQARSDLAEANAANELLARALAERMAREKQFEELARAAAQERDDIAERCVGRVMRVEKDRDEAARERDDLRLALSHLNLVDSSSGSSMSVSTDSDEPAANDVTTVRLGAQWLAPIPCTDFYDDSQILRTVSKELQLENARAQAFAQVHTRSDSLDSLNSDKSLPSYTESDMRTASKPPVPALLTPKLTPILNTSDSDTTLCIKSKAGSQEEVTIVVETTTSERRKMLDALPLPSNLPLKEPPPMVVPARYSFSDVFGHSLGNRVRLPFKLPMTTLTRLLHAVHPGRVSFLFLAHATFGAEIRLLALRSQPFWVPSSV